MKKPNVFTGAIFGLTGLVSLIFSHDWLQAGMWLTLGGGLFLSDLRYRSAGAAEGGSTTTVPLSPARKYLSMGLVLVSLLLFGFMVSRDFKASQHRKTSTHNAR
ncbi:hypothetical protein [Hymenobacter sp. APR13]|uniref:hypothetical protein n=1 Tax=Hymenobacter sp. APR13 TaxID=1356852 RepID=UPI0004E0815C|nr:hypothetical protein [Hymenobacter sp. APR13]AII51115.1 hypothetical protein N008_03840 [Hymenobacter sp. APR13]